MLTARARIELPPSVARECAQAFAVACGLVVTWLWVVTLRHSHGFLLAGLSILALAWMAGMRAQLSMLGQSWMVVAMSVPAWTAARHIQRQRQAALLVAEHLDESLIQSRNTCVQLTEAVDGLQRRQQRYTALQVLARRLGQITELTDVCQLLITEAHAMVNQSQDCLLFLMDHASQRLALTASHRGHGAPPIATKHGDVFDESTLRARKGLLIEDAPRHPLYRQNESMGRAVRSVVATPITIDERVEGILRLDSPAAHAYTQEDLRLLGIIAELGSTAIATARLHARTQELAMTDGLTGVLVRRAFLERLRHELLRAQRNGECRTLLMVDIDHFKRYNDTHGHTAGDRVLKGVAQLLSTHAGADGLVARYGGEEFTVLLGLTALPQSQPSGERIRQAIAREPFVLRRQETHVTVSIGAAQFPADGHEIIELLRVADQRLYHAKQAGRNQLCGPP